MNRSKILKRTEKMLKLANNLTNEEICCLFNMTSDRFDIFLGSLGGCQISTKVTWAGMNGSLIQVNTELADLNDIRDDLYIDDAFKAAKKKTKKA